MTLLAVCGIATVLASLLAASFGLLQARWLARYGDDLGVATARANELRRIARQRQQLAAAQALGEGAVDGTTRAVQGIHRGIASIPFGVLESIPATRDTTRIVREIHDLAADSAYGTIRGVNRLLGKGMRRGLQRPARRDHEDNNG